MLDINKHDVCWTENQNLGAKIKLIKGYIHSTNNANVFSFVFFRLNKLSKCEMKFFLQYWIIELLDAAFVDRRMNYIIIFCLVKDTVMQKPLRIHWKTIAYVFEVYPKI